MLENTFKWFQQSEILYLDYYEVSTYNKSNNMSDFSRYTNLKLVNERKRVKWIKVETMNAKMRLMILQITFFFIVITVRMFYGVVIFTTNISAHCKSDVLYLHLFVTNLILEEQILNFNNTVGVGISSGITGMYASPECS